MASASHDLRQPAHALSLFIETLSRTELNDTQKKDCWICQNSQ
ncbi:hypothetical protein [Psychrobacter phenylpyruvicus]